jgi:hypothetical protein
MKVTVSDNGDYSVHAELTEVISSKKTYALKFSSKLKGAKDSDEEQQKFIMFLSEDERKVLKDLL